MRPRGCAGPRGTSVSLLTLRSINTILLSARRCRAAPRRAVCRAVPCYAIPCQAMPCHAIPWCAKVHPAEQESRAIALGAKVTRPSCAAGPASPAALPRECTTALCRAASEMLNHAVLNPFIHRHRAAARIGLLGLRRIIRSPRRCSRNRYSYTSTLRHW